MKHFIKLESFRRKWKVLPFSHLTEKITLPIAFHTIKMLLNEIPDHSNEKLNGTVLFTVFQTISSGSPSFFLLASFRCSASWVACQHRRISSCAFSSQREKCYTKTRKKNWGVARRGKAFFPWTKPISSFSLRCAQLINAWKMLSL